MIKKINIMPVAGKGQRFINQNYTIPKPFIKINNQYMFIKAAKSLPIAHKTFFIFMSSIKKKYNINKIINSNFKKKYSLFFLNKKSDGQADTCYKLIKKLNLKDELFINACDVSFAFDKRSFQNKKNNNDMVIFTTKSLAYHHKRANNYGWVYSSRREILISCKQKVKNTKNQDIIIGAFYFKNMKIYLNIFKYLKKNRIKINNEYYIDQMFVVAQKLGYKIDKIKVKNYKSYGTPEEIKNN